jgi:type III secretory pathway component EscU
LLGKFRFQWKPSPFSSFRHLFTQRFVIPLRAAVLFLILIFAVIFLLQSSAVSFGFQLGIGFTLAVLLVGFLAFQLATQKGRQALRNFISKFINKGGAS